MRSYRRILVPVDGSPTCKKALVAALQIARDSGGRVRLVHVVDDLAFVTGFESGAAVVLDAVRKGGERVLASANDMALSAGVPSEVSLIELPGERLGDCIAREATDWNADLVVVGTHGRHGVRRVLLGSGAEQVIRLSPVPVLVIRDRDSTPE